MNDKAACLHSNDYSTPLAGLASLIGQSSYLNTKARDISTLAPKHTHNDVNLHARSAWRYDLYFVSTWFLKAT